ncbi:S8 family serine peptidase, partial [uncultured Deinococcus sp.]|uniref:S8 family serine peptidase n=1 Tax=uncultured Deinococcus sp. TaxID=158789 RepID=UPI0025CF0948
GNGTIGLWGNGTIGLWGNGTIGLWGNGTIGLWGNGRYEPIPQNSDPWQQIALDDVQAGRRASGNGMTVAVIDTGVDLNHPALAGGFTEPSTWHDFVDGDATPQDEGELGHGLTGHGTEVAGIVAQVAPAAKVMPLRVLGPDGTGDVASVAAAIVWAVDHGADVINLSLGSDQAMTAVSQAIAYANSQGVVVAAAAGNTGAEGIDYPAAEFAAQPMNVAVGSVDLHDVKSAFSQYGALELLAPGEAIYGPAPQERSAAWSGTSMSAPVVAGGLALALEGGATGAQAAAALTGTATSVDGVQGNAAYAGKLGAGRIDLNAALTSLGR